MVKVKIIWSDFALDNVEAIGEEIEKKSPQAAENVVTEIYNRVTQLESFPLSGTIEERLTKLGLDHRFLVIYSYKIIYRLIDENTVFITDVFPCRKDPVELPKRAKKTTI